MADHLTGGITAVAQERSISDEAFASELCGIAGTSDRVRLVALDRTRELAAADAHRLRRELALQTAKWGQDSAEVKVLEEQLSVQQTLQTEITAEIQRAEIEVPKRQDGLYIVLGRVVDAKRLGQTGLTVSLVNVQGHPFTFTCTNALGSFQLEIPATDQDDPGTTEPNSQSPQSELSLQVSDPGQAILYRGDESLTPVAGGVVYREIILGDEREEPCPPPPMSTLMPDLTGLPERTAIDLLNELGLTVAERQTALTDDPDKVGSVLRQAPAPGATVTAATPITLIIGIEQKTVLVPHVVGLKLEEARRKITDNDLTLGTVAGPDPSNDSIVHAQEPKANTGVPVGTAVNLQVRPPAQGMVDTLLERIIQDDAFPQLDASSEDLRQRLESLGVETTEQVAALLTDENREVRDKFQLRSLRRAQTFKQILRRVLEAPE